MQRVEAVAAGVVRQFALRAAGHAFTRYMRLKADAGLPEDGGLHDARHLFAMEMRRVAGIDAASHALGHPT